MECENACAWNHWYDGMAASYSEVYYYNLKIDIWYCGTAAGRWKKAKVAIALCSVALGVASINWEYT